LKESYVRLLFDAYIPKKNHFIKPSQHKTKKKRQLKTFLHIIGKSTLA